MSQGNKESHDIHSHKVEEAHNRLENAFNKMMEEIDRDVIRQNYVDMLMCSANCYKDRSSPIEVVHSCAEKCNQKLEKGTNFFQRELDNMEISIAKCAKGCEDIGANHSDSKNPRSQSFIDQENCLIKCVDIHIEQFPALKKRIQESLAK
uniref:Protein FAM136A-like isoform X2 n=1 Tax=Crassostrea virginica TaxID=6565 RepID=A0A8B8E1R1_CRAVI|nr:protein FAM136A-like isoform X2 [Crassostrea virginica]